MKLVKVKRSEMFGGSVINLLLILTALACLIPFVIVISISLSSEAEIAARGYGLLPRGWNLTAYRYVFKKPEQILQAYKISAIVTVAGTALSVFAMSMAAYCLARKNFRFRKAFMFYIFFTMLFSGGLVPTYILVSSYLRLSNTIWALILPGLVNAFHVVLLRTFFQKLPPALFESTKIDGANEFVIFTRIALPLSTPALATVALLGGLGRWNDWFNALLYINTDSLVPLQYLLYRIMSNLQFIAMNYNTMPEFARDTSAIPSETMRMAMCVIAAGPMMFVFPFFQKYFVKGLTVGSVKE
ncbi:MAG: carbohydrate ABC transporter permease [Clostridiales bacterium]|jgi:putative aldouronate transport system permease protein|nr:carbohydrate ABC transporter permease [Clostridiales bacterium]